MRVGCGARLTITLTQRFIFAFSLSLHPLLRPENSTVYAWTVVPAHAPSFLVPIRSAPVPFGLPATVHPTGLGAGAGATVLFDRQGALRLRKKRAHRPQGDPEHDIRWHLYPTPTYSYAHTPALLSLCILYIISRPGLVCSVLIYFLFLNFRFFFVFLWA